MAIIQFRNPQSKQFIDVDIPVPYIEANPSGGGTATLNRLEINGTVYNIVSQGSGSAVIANTTPTDYDTKLTTINIEGVNYYLQDLNIQRKEMPTPKLSEMENIYQYIGEDYEDPDTYTSLKHGYFYTCTQDTAHNVFVWTPIQTSIVNTINAANVVYQSESLETALENLDNKVIGNPQELGTEDLKELKIGTTTYSIPDNGVQIYIGDTAPTGETAKTAMIWINTAEDY